MKIVFTGGGTGGHFYPIIAVAQAVNRLADENKLLRPGMYFFAPTPYNPGLLYDNHIEYKKTIAGKMRRYFSFLNFFDYFKIAWGVLGATLDLYDIYPDVVFGKGGYGSFPTLMAARLLRIPIVIHESDCVPGRVSKWAGKFATRIAVSWPEAAKFFKADKVAHTGQPVQRLMLQAETNGAHRYFGFEESAPTIFIMGGSQGAEKINNIVLDVLPKLLEKYNVIHQTGVNNLKVVQQAADVVLLDSRHKDRYKVFGYLNALEERMAAGCADVVISRAGSTIFEIAAWGRASIIIPIEDSNGDHQNLNAFNYKKSGACETIEERNLAPSIFLAEIEKIVTNPELKQKMAEAAHNFFLPDADRTIAQELLRIALEHEKE